MTSRPDKEDFIKILNDYKWILLKIINSYCKDPEDRKDLEQEIIIQLWKSFETFNSEYKLSTWVYKIAMNVSISYYRSNLNRKTKTSQINESVFTESSYIDKSVHNNEQRKLLNDFINKLDDINKEIIILYLDDLSYREIAEIVGVSESNVGTKLNRIKKKCQEFFQNINSINYGTR